MKTIKLRIKDRFCRVLDKLASEVNFVWNYVNDLCFKHLKRKGVFLSSYDVDKYTQGASKECDLHSQTIQAISAELVTRRKQFKKEKLKWRVSNKKSARRSLGWIPFKKAGIRYGAGYIKYGKHQFKVWDSYGLDKFEVKSGSFVEDARGRWYACLVVETSNVKEPNATKSIGIDFTQKDTAYCSDGTVIANHEFYRKYEQKLGTAQKAKNKKRVQALHAKIANCRKDYLHKISTQLVKDNALIVVGGQNPNENKTSRQYGALDDIGFSVFKNMLMYKCENAKALFEDIGSKFTPQIGDNADHGIRVCEGECSNAKIILALGHKRLGVEIPLQ